MNPPPRLLILAALIALGACALSSCGAVRDLCSPSGLCAETPPEPQPVASGALLSVRPGEQRSVTLSVDLRGLPPQTTMRFVSGMDGADPSVRPGLGAQVAVIPEPTPPGPGGVGAGGPVLATFDGGRVVLRGAPDGFGTAGATLTVTAAPDAAPTLTPERFHTAGRLAITRTDASTSRVSPFALSIQVTASQD